MTISELIEELECEMITSGPDAIVGISAFEKIDDKKNYKYKIIPIEKVCIATKCVYKDLKQKDKYVVLIPELFHDLFVKSIQIKKEKK